MLLSRRKNINRPSLLYSLTGKKAPNNRIQSRPEHDKAKLDLLRRRLDEFYAPIYGLLVENDRVRLLVAQEFGRGIIFVGGNPLSEDEQHIWVHYLENYVIPNNRAILDILQTKMHLFVGETYPESFRHWIDHALGYELFHKQYQDFGREYGFHSCMNFPRRFRTDIVNAISQLIKLQEKIAGVELPSPFIETPNKMLQATSEGCADAPSTCV